MKRILILLPDNVLQGLRGCSSSNKTILLISKQLFWLKARGYQLDMIHSERRKAFFCIKENLTSTPNTSKL